MSHRGPFQPPPFCDSVARGQWVLDTAHQAPALALGTRHRRHPASIPSPSCPCLCPVLCTAGRCPRELGPSSPRTLACPVRLLATQLHAMESVAPAGQAVQPTSRALLRRYPGPWVQGMSPLASLALPSGLGAVGQGTALPGCHPWGNRRRASGQDIPALVINLPYRVVSSRSRTGTFCPQVGQTSEPREWLLRVSPPLRPRSASLGTGGYPRLRGRGWQCRIRAPLCLRTPVRVPGLGQPRVSSCRHLMAVHSQRCSSPCPSRAPGPGAAGDPQAPALLGASQPGNPRLSLPVAGDTSASPRLLRLRFPLIRSGTLSLLSAQNYCPLQKQ